MQSFLIYIVLICLSITSHAQLNNFIDSGAVWSIDDYKLFIINQDSTIGTKDYKKVFAIKDSIIDFTNSYLYSLVRYDSITQKVYTLYPNSSSEKLLYDFNVVIGDTILVSQFDPVFFEERNICNQELMVRVESIDSIYFNGIYLKRYNLSGVNWFYSPEYWVEGIGSSFGLFGSGIIDCDVADIATPSLLCFKYRDSTLFLTPEEVCYKKFNPPTSINIVDFNDLQVFPNPFNNFIIINSEYTIKYIDIQSIHGQKIEFNYSKKENKIDILKQTRGIYVINLIVSDGLLTKQKQFKILKN